jgi:histidinol dehydrogenase
MKRLDTAAPDFESNFAALLDEARETTARVDAAVAGIIAEVRERGDAALVDFTTRFDRWMPADAAALRVTAEEIEAADARIDAELRTALNLAAERIEVFHRAQLPADLEMKDSAGLTLGMRWGAIDAVGLYVPGGKAAYPSSVLMNAIPARAAGVPRIAMCVPTPDGVLNPLVLAAAKRAGVTEVFRIGGAQAVAAMAWGTARIAPGRSHRRAGQCVCGGSQAAGLRPGGDRFHRRPVGGGRHRRWRQRSAPCRTRPARPGRAR